MAARRDGAEQARWLCSVLVMVFTLAACAADGGGGGSPEPWSSTNGTSTGTTGSPTSDETTSRPKSRNIIAWILNLGAGSPPGPADDYMRAYDALLERDCEGALSEATSNQVQSVIEATATACLAALRGDDGLWEFAQERRDALADAEDLSCLDVGVFALLERLLDKHSEDPDLAFEFQAGDEEGAPPCPTDIGLEPNRGEPGDIVTITGKNLEFVKGALFDFGTGEDECSNEENCIELDGAHSLAFEIPEPPDGVSSVRVVVLADPAQWQMGAATFEYVAPTVGPPEPPETTTGGPAEPDPEPTVPEQSQRP